MHPGSIIREVEGGEDQGMPVQTFLQQLRATAPAETANRRWIYVAYDQLSEALGPLVRTPPSELGIVLIESREKASRRPYHKQKLALVLANQRHFALEQAARGVALRYELTRGSYRQVLERVAAEVGPLEMMRPAERELRAEIVPLVERGTLAELSHDGWLTTRDDFVQFAGREAPWRMDAFYRGVRRKTGILMAEGKPIGGKFSLDAENRQPWRGHPAAPEPPSFQPDEITREVGALVETEFAHHPGRLDLAALPATSGDAAALWSWALSSCMEHFGTFEDAMSRQSSGLFHTRISPLLNLHRLLPKQVVDDVLELDIPLNSKEGFIRQILGWREFVHHVHVATDGFRQLAEVADRPGDAGYGAWSGTAWPWVTVSEDSTTAERLGGALPNRLDAHNDLPPVFWGARSGLGCLDRVIEDVWREGWSHHITRLMVLSNLATLLDVSPRQLADWFWVAYIDAFDWVVEPNVLGMGSYALGPLFTTKPYVSGANYIHKMGDYCSHCAFDPETTCPITPLYWQFLDRHRVHLEGNPRVSLPLRSLERRSSQKRERDREIYRHVTVTLGRGESLQPEQSPG